MNIIIIIIIKGLTVHLDNYSCAYFVLSRS